MYQNHVSCVWGSGERLLYPRNRWGIKSQRRSVLDCVISSFDCPICAIFARHRIWFQISGTQTATDRGGSRQPSDCDYFTPELGGTYHEGEGDAPQVLPARGPQVHLQRRTVPPRTLNPKPHTPHPTTPHPTPHTPNPTPSSTFTTTNCTSMHPQPHTPHTTHPTTPHPTPHTLKYIDNYKLYLLAPSTPDTEHCTLNPEPFTTTNCISIHPQPRTLNPASSTPTPEPCTPNPKSQILNPAA